VNSYINGDLEIKLVLEHLEELNHMHKLPRLLDLFLRVCVQEMDRKTVSSKKLPNNWAAILS